MMLTRITAPIEPLLTVPDLADHLRVSHNDEDGWLANAIADATHYLDAGTGVLGEALVTQGWRLTLSAAPVGLLVLPLGPVQSVTVVKYIDGTGAEQTYSAANYRLAGRVLELVSGASWPATDARTAAFWVDYVAGYGGAADVPGTIRHSAMLMAADFYENRTATGETMGQTEAFKMLLAASRSDRGLF